MTRQLTSGGRDVGRFHLSHFNKSSVEFFIVMAITVIALGVFVWAVIFGVVCDKEARIAKPEPAEPIVSIDQISSQGIMTVKHNGHLFTVLNFFSSAALIHSPSCPCLQNSQKDK